MPDRTFPVATAYLVALVASFVTALASVLVPGSIESTVGADGLQAVQLGSSLGLIGLLALADRVNERLGIGVEERTERTADGRQEDDEWSREDERESSRGDHEWGSREREREL